ncbi:uncharacterized protein G2W53_042287 [Senna tora]|uniref:Uncharacterized protein n=1 Tax=Senna tora TaxID=362788 RepID=A0A834SGK3_9FABA|nr:uncharacterized protein G2W53_042287 [Senna tora]
MFSFFLQSAMATALSMKNIFIGVFTGVFSCFLIGSRIYLEHSQGQGETPLLPIVREASNSNSYHPMLPITSGPVHSHTLLQVDIEDNDSNTIIQRKCPIFIFLECSSPSIPINFGNYNLRSRLKI